VLAWRENLAGAKIKEVELTPPGPPPKAGPNGRSAGSVTTTSRAGSHREYAEDLLLTVRVLSGDRAPVGAQTWAGAKFTPPAPAELERARFGPARQMGASRMATLRGPRSRPAPPGRDAFAATPSRLAGNCSPPQSPGVVGMQRSTRPGRPRAAWLLLSKRGGECFTRIRPPLGVVSGWPGGCSANRPRTCRQRSSAATSRRASQSTTAQRPVGFG